MKNACPCKYDSKECQFFICLMIGLAAGYAVYFLTHCKPEWLAWTLTGGLCGLVVFISLPFIKKVKITEIEFFNVKLSGELAMPDVNDDTLLVMTGNQRHVAWKIFMELTTRITTQPMPIQHGDDGVAIKSIHKAFGTIKELLLCMELTPFSKHKDVNSNEETIETFTLDILNNHLRPLLAKWHPLWDSHEKQMNNYNNCNPSTGNNKSLEWAHHEKFREELEVMRHNVAKKTIYLGRLSQFHKPERYFVTSQSK